MIQSLITWSHMYVEQGARRSWILQASELWWSLVWFTTKVGWYALYETCGHAANNEHKNKNWTAASFAKHVHLVHWASLGSCRGKKKKKRLIVLAIYIYTLYADASISDALLGWDMSWTPDRYKNKRHLREYCIFGNMCWLKGIVKEVN